MNNIKNQKRFLLMMLTGLLSTKICGCGYTNEDSKAVTIEAIKLDVESNEIQATEAPKTYEIIEIPSITATDNVFIRESSSVCSPVIGMLQSGKSIEKIEQLASGWYEVEYYNRSAYVSSDYSKDSITYDIKGKILKTYYAKEDFKLPIFQKIDGTNEQNLSISKYEHIEIYEETSDNYLVKIGDDYIGYVKKENILKYVEDSLKSNYQIIEVSCVIATTQAPIYNSANNGTKIGTLKEGSSLKILNKLDNGYEVEYYDYQGFISKEYVEESSYYDITGEISKICYATSDIELTIPSELNNSLEEKVSIPKEECFEIYEELDNEYLVKTIDYIGYVKKENLEQLRGTLVTVDISSQEVTLYENNEVILKAPVVTGNPNKGNSTTEGLFEIYSITRNRFLKGNGYSSYVDVMMSFDGSEGLHDAEKHYCENGKKNNHGWRNISNFGGDTYLTNGSHGCVNMPHEAAFEVLEHSEVGTKVLIKK